MKINLFLLPVILLFYQMAPLRLTDQTYTYELSIRSEGEKTELFDLLIEGQLINETGEMVPFRLEEKNLKTPYNLTLGTGQYVIRVHRQSEQGVVISKVQGVLDGRRKGSAQGSSRKQLLTAGPGGNYSGGEDK